MRFYILAFKNYLNFDSRATRKEFWFFSLFHIIAMLICSFLDGLLFSAIFVVLGFDDYIISAYLLFSLIPSLSVAVRRLHDVGKSGWFYFLCLIPLVGQIWLLILFLKESENKENAYGPISMTPA